MKMLLKTFILCLTTTLLVVGCGESQDKITSQINDAQVQTLITDAEELTFLMDTGRILRRASDRDRLQIRGVLERIKSASLLLDENPQNRSALISLKSAFKFFDEIVVTERDQPRLNDVFNQARSLLAKYANIQGVSLTDLQWSIFSYRFSNGIAPFGSPDVPSQWSTRFVQQERYAINVRGENKTAALLSPTFDLSNVDNPGYSLRHSFQVEEHFIPRPFFDRNLILDRAFVAYASTTYKDGDEVDFDNRNQWQRVPLGNLPTGLNFNTVDSGINSLKRYEGEKRVTLAFVFRNNEALGNHILAWSIERFNLYGVTEKLKYQSRPQPFDPDAQDDLGTNVWHHDFNEVQMGDLQQVTLAGAPGSFIASEHRGTLFVKMQEQGVEGTQLLYSPVIDISEVEDPYIRVQHTINFYDEQYREKHNVKIVMAKDEPGKDIKDLNWIRINFEKNNPPGGDWDIYKSEFVEIPPQLQGKKVRVGWSHTAEGDSTPVWQIHDTWIRDIPELKE